MKTINKFISFVLTLATLLSLTVPAMAADLVNSSGSKATDIAVIDNSSYSVSGSDSNQNKKSEFDTYTYTGDTIVSSVNVYGTIAEGSNVYDPDNLDADENGYVDGKIEVGVPTTIIFSGTADSEGYYVGKSSGRVKGNISGSTVIAVVPDDSFTLSSKGKDDITATVEQDYTQFVVETSELTGDKVNKNVTPSYNDKAVFNVKVKTNEATAGSWKGSFNYNISLMNSATASLGTRITSWDVSATSDDDVWMSYYQTENSLASGRSSAFASPNRAASNSNETTIEKFEDGTVVVSGTGNMEAAVNKHFFDVDAMCDTLTAKIWNYLRDNLTAEEYASVTSELDENTQTYYYESSSSIKSKNISDLSSQTKDFLREALDAVYRSINSSDYIKYVPKKVIILDGVTNVSNSAFSSCRNIDEVVLPNSIKRIEGSAFMNCFGLTKINIPDGCEYIGGSAFYCCSDLGTIRVPSSVNEIGGVTTFVHNSIEIDERNRSYVLIDGTIYNKDVTKLVGVTKDTPKNLVIPDTVTTINSTALRKENTTVTIPASVVNIPTNAFGAYSKGVKVICKSQAVYDSINHLIEENAGTNNEFKGTVELSID